MYEEREREREKDFNRNDIQYRGEVCDDDDVFYFFLQEQKRGAELHIYLEEGTYHKRLFRGSYTNDMKK